jgi:hypothetical protein
MKAFFATARPPAVVIVPPLVELIASVVFEMPRPPERSKAPEELLVLVVVSSKTTEPLVALEVDLIVVLLFAAVPPVRICPPVLPARRVYWTWSSDKSPVSPECGILALPVTVKFPPTERSVPMKAFFATANPPAVVMVPPLIELIASVAFEIPRPPERSKAPEELELVAVVSSKTTEPLVALEVDRIVVLLFAAVPPVIIWPPERPARRVYWVWSSDKSPVREL